MHDGFDDRQWEEVSEAILAGKPTATAAREALLGAAAAFLDMQLRFQKRAVKRFEHPERWLWTNQLLEQASDERSAKLTASYFPIGSAIYDLCCGAGADAVSLAHRGNLTAVDRSPVAAALTKANLKLNESKATVVCDDVTAIAIPDEAYIHVDPDRRSDGHRTTAVERFEPGVEFLLGLLDRSQAGSMKVAPATRLEDFIDAAAQSEAKMSPVEKIGTQFVSWGGDVRQQRWWWNVEAFPAGSTTVSVMHRGAWSHWSVRDIAKSNVPSCYIDNRDELSDYTNGFIGDADGAVRAASLQPALAKELAAGLVDSPNGYFLSHCLPDRAPPGLIDWFRIEAVVPFDRKKLRAYLRERRVGRLEIKVRRIEVPVDELRKELKLVGEESRTLLLTKCNGRAVAIIAERVTTV